jgi:heat shock protein HtpX
VIRNTIESAVLLGAISGLMVVSGGLLGGHIGVIIGIGLGGTVVASSWWFSDRLAIRAAEARVLDASEVPGLHAMVNELARRSMSPPPQLYLSPSPQPNAFATGRNPRHAALVVTEGLLALLEPTEVRAVLAHELAHVCHRDTLLTSVAGAVATAISAVANFDRPTPLIGGRSHQDGSGPIGAPFVALLAPVAAGLLQIALSRSREYEADRAGADLTHDPETLARALERIGGYVDVVPMELMPAQASAWVVSPLGAGVDFARLFSTHPPLADRIARLRATPQPAGGDMTLPSRTRMSGWRRANGDHRAGSRG